MGASIPDPVMPQPQNVNPARVQEKAQPLSPTAPRHGSRLRVLFVCIGNSCRSPMAEGFARRYGSDVMEVESAGLSPINRVAPHTVKVMQDKNIDVTAAVPKGLDIVDPQSFGLIVNLSGGKLPSIAVPVEDWQVDDPFGRDEAAFRQASETIEGLVMRLILQLRLGQHPALAKAAARHSESAAGPVPVARLHD